MANIVNFVNNLVFHDMHFFDFVIFLKNCVAFLSDLTDLSDLLIVKSPNIVREAQ